jgi:hypothetical protein
MATKGTKYSDVQFSVPAGADPMGIGVPDLGRSSYDPLATIRQGWDEMRQDRQLKDAERKQEYQNYMEALPTFDEVNTKVAQKLNESVVKMGDYAHQKYKSGAWSPFARNEEGLPVERELSRLENKIATEGAAYNAMLPKYQEAEKFARDPDNFEKIDWDLTTPRMQAFTEAEDIEGMTRALNKPLVVTKPEPVELNEYLKKMIPTYIQGDDVEQVSSVFDPEMNKWQVTERTYKDPERTAEGMKKMYRNMDDRYKNEVDRRFERAPQNQKVTADGVPIDVEDWFATQYVPEYGEKLNVSYVAGKDEGGRTDWSFLPGKRDDGTFDLKPYEEVKVLGMKSGETTERVSFNSAATIPLQGVSKKPFVMPNTFRARDAETGEQVAPGRSTMNVMDNVSIMPVASEDINVTMPDGSTRTITAGEKIDRDVQSQMLKNNMGGKMQWEAFLTTLTSNKQVAEQLQYQGIPLGTDTKSFTETTIRPWNESLQYVKEAARADDVDIQPMVTRVNEILNQLNSDYGEVFETAKVLDDDEAYNTIFE